MSAEEPQLFIALYTDEDVSTLLAELLRQEGYDAISALEVDMIGVPDEEHLTYAAAHDRAILTFNYKDFIPLGKEWFEQGQDHAGIIYSQQLGRKVVGELLRQTLNLLNAVSADEMRNTIRNLQSYR